MARKQRIDFDDYYRGIFGSRWKGLSESLLSEPRYFALQEGLRKPYYIDEASVSAARLLDASGGDRILDLCAAPGGKTLVLAGSIGGEGLLIANDRSSARRARLKRVIEEHLKPDLASRLRITGHDARRWSLHEREVYDRVLLDVPCSSERHVIRSAVHKARWSPVRSRHLAAQAYAMAASALDTIRIGGSLLYVTCALSPLENDGVIERLRKRRADRFSLSPIELPYGEPTELGWLVLPDQAGGRGPIFVCKLKRTT